MKKKNSIILWVCIGLIVLAGGIFTVSKIVENRRIAAGIAADIAAANEIFRETGRKPFGLINGEPFFSEDLDVYRSEMRAAVANHFGRLHNLGGMGADFWETEFDGITPMQFLNELAVNDLTRNMIIIQQARIRGLDAPNTYSDLELEREIWNAPTDEITFGPRTLGPAEYVSYRMLGITNALKTALLENELEPTVAQLKKAYESLPPGFKLADFMAAGTRFTWNEGPTANEIVHMGIQNLLTQGYSPEEVVERLSPVPGISQEEFEFINWEVRRSDDYGQILHWLLRDAELGSLIPGPEGEEWQGWQPSLYFVTVFEGGGLYSFEEAPGLGRNKWINDQFPIFLDRKTKEARITLFRDEDFNQD
jgi:hypothetical protein